VYDVLLNGKNTVDTTEAPASRRALDATDPNLIKPKELECAYPARPETVGRIRDTVTRAAHEWGAPLDTCTRIRLVVSELATNSVAASDPDAMIRVRLRGWPLVIRVGVWDACPDEPKIKDGDLSLDEIDALPEDHDFGGWGIVLVQELASGHHVEQIEAGGKYVWADFDLPDGHILSPLLHDDATGEQRG
jgi:anti-sigma regulatory factor (Ser/Thr protein kinase)